MKKEKPKQKPKEFAASPFKGLKGAALELREPVAAPAPPEKPAEKAVPAEDAALFFEAVAGVRRMHAAAAAPAKVKAQAGVKAQRDEEEQRIFMQAVEALKMDVRFSDALPEEELSQRPLPVNRLRQLRRGGIRIDLQLDLHGLTKDEAIENLDRFVKAAYLRGQKGVLVITGKGMNSPGEPVLKSAVSAWLRDAGRSMVSEFAQAPKEMGGGGAFVVFLKEHKVKERPGS